MAFRGKLKTAGLMQGALIAAATSLFPVAAHAACAISVEPTQSELVVRHNPLEDGAARGTIEVNLVNRGDSECVGRLGASLRGEQFGLRSNGGGAPILYQLVDERSNNDITPRAGRNLQSRGGRLLRLQPGERSLEIISINAVPEGSMGQGRYVQTLDLDILSVDGMPLATKPITLGIDIVPAALIGIKGPVARARGANSINLGELEPGVRELPVTLYVVSTGGYRVSVSSDNQGRLRHENSQWFIDYRLRLGRYDLDLARTDGFEVMSNRARFDNYPMKIEVGQTDGKRAGTYVDRVTFTVAAL